MVLLMENPPLHDVLKRLLWSHKETQPQCGLLLLRSDLCNKYRFYFVSREGVLHHSALWQGWRKVGEGTQECPAFLYRDFESILFSVPSITACLRRTQGLHVQSLFRVHWNNLTYFRHLGFCCCFCSAEKVIIPVCFIFSNSRIFLELSFFLSLLAFSLYSFAFLRVKFQ